MLGINREVLEFAVIGLTTIRVGYSLWTGAGVGACISYCWGFVHVVHFLPVRRLSWYPRFQAGSWLGCFLSA